MNPNNIKVVTKPCMVCKEHSVLELNREAFEAWQKGAMIHGTGIPREYRELLISGTHDACWKKLSTEEGNV